MFITNNFYNKRIINFNLIKNTNQMHGWNYKIKNILSLKVNIIIIFNV
jgi:hypothetical protein